MHKILNLTDVQCISKLSRKANPKGMLIISIVLLQQQYQSALFWADKVASLSHGKWLLFTLYFINFFRIVLFWWGFSAVWLNVGILSLF